MEIIEFGIIGRMLVSNKSYYTHASLWYDMVSSITVLLCCFRNGVVCVVCIAFEVIHFSLLSEHFHFGPEWIIEYLSFFSSRKKVQFYWRIRSYVQGEIWNQVCHEKLWKFYFKTNPKAMFGLLEENRAEWIKI